MEIMTNEVALSFGLLQLIHIFHRNMSFRCLRDFQMFERKNICVTCRPDVAP